LNNSEYLVQRINQSVDRLSPISRLNYVVPVSISLVAVLFAFPGINVYLKEVVALGMLISLLLVMHILPHRLRRSIDSLVRVQDAIFFARNRIDHMHEERIGQLLQVLTQIESFNNATGSGIEQLEAQAMNLIEETA
jgi:hypothetical protein